MNYSIITPEVIMRSMMGKPTMAKQFVDMYIFQSPIDFTALEEGMKVGNARIIADCAHHIKPTMEYIGASSLRLAFQELENMGKSDTELEIIRDKFNEIKPKFELMIEELKNFAKEIDLQRLNKSGL